MTTMHWKTEPRVPKGKHEGGRWAGTSVRWSPAMPKKRADMWAEGTEVADTVWHRTSFQNAQEITKNGFQIGTGTVWGAGVYAALDKDDADRMDGEVTLPLKVRLVNPLRVQTPDAELSWRDCQRLVLERIAAEQGQTMREVRAEFQRLQTQEQQQFDRNEALHKWRNSPFAERLVSGRALTGLLRHYGHDGVIVVSERWHDSIGGSQVMVVKPKNVTVVKSQGLHGHILFCDPSAVTVLTDVSVNGMWEPKVEVV